MPLMGILGFMAFRIFFFFFFFFGGGGGAGCKEP